MADLTPEQTDQLLQLRDQVDKGLMTREEARAEVTRLGIVEAPEIPSPDLPPMGAPVPDVSKTVGKAMGELWSTPLGVDPETVKEFTGREVPFFLRMINRPVIEGGSAAADLVFRALEAPVIALAGGVSTAYQDLTDDQGGARRLFRDIMNLSLAAGVASSSAPINYRRWRKQKLDEVEQYITEQTKAGAFSEETAEALRGAARQADETSKQFISTQEVIPPPLMQLRELERLNPKVRKVILDAFEESGIPLRTDTPISIQVAEAVQKDQLKPGDIQALMMREGLSMQELAGLFRADVSEAGRTLGQLSALQRRLQKLADRMAEGDETAAEEFGDAFRSPRDVDNVRMMDWWRRMDNARRGLMVSQPATAARNAIVGVGRVGLDTMNDAIDISLQRMFGLSGKPQRTPVESFGNTLRFFMRPIYKATIEGQGIEGLRANKKLVDDVLAAFPSERDTLFLRYSSDVIGMGGKLEKAVNAANVFNRFQEFIFRRAKFASELDRRLRRKGTSLRQAVENNEIENISAEDIKESVQSALDFTFAKEPESKLAQDFVDAVMRSRVGTFVIPFPRFVTNAIRFNFETSPLGFVRLASPKTLKAIAKGDTSALSKAISGSTIFLTAWQLRNSEAAGEKWYELKVGDKTVDIRPFNPFAAHFFVADLIKRQKEGTLPRIQTSEIVEGLLSFRTGVSTGVAALDEIAESIVGIRDKEEGVRAFTEVISRGFSGFLTPIRTLQDVVAEFDADEAIKRETISIESPVNINPLIEPLPIARRLLPAKESPTREAAPRAQAGIFRQLTGLSLVEPKNPVEKKLDRLGFTFQEVLPRIGVAAYDNLVAKHMGRLVEERLTEFVQSPGLNDKPLHVQAELMRRALSPIRELARELAIRDLAKAGRRDVILEVTKRRFPRRTREVLERTGAQ